MNLRTIYEHTRTDTTRLNLEEQRSRMRAALPHMPSSAVDVAKRDKTGTLKRELKAILEQVCKEELRNMSEDEAAYAPSSRAEKALNELLL